jgi:hypothetical protein
MQGDLASLSASIGAMQTEVKQASTAAREIRQAAQSSFAAAIAFMQLRAAAEAGRGYAPELSSLRATAPSDAQFRDILSRLDTSAAKGAPTLSQLREEYQELEGTLTVAVDRSEAKTFWQRVLAAIRGLISIRPEHGGTVGVDAQIENALAAGDLKTAVAASKDLPKELEPIIRDWQNRVEARVVIDESLQELADRFVAIAGTPLSSAAPQAAP